MVRIAMDAHHPIVRITRSRPIRRGLLGGLAALFVLAIGTGALLGVVLGSSLDGMSERVRHADELAAHASDLRASMLDQETGLRGYQLTGDDVFLQPYRLGLRREEGSLAALIVDGESDELRLAAREVGAAAAEWRAEWVQEQMRLVETGDFAAVRERAATGGGRMLFDRIRGGLGRVDLAIAAIRSAAFQNVEEARRVTDVVIVGAVAAYGAALLLAGLWVVRRVERPLAELVTTAEALERGDRVQFVARRDDEIGTLATTLERLQATAQQRYEVTAALAERSTVMNRLSELMSYADDEDAVIRAGVAALERLVPSRGGEVLLVNPSFDQLRVHSGWGDVTTLGANLAVDRPTACPGIRRNTVHVTRSALDAFSLTCAIHPLRSGSLLCVPMVSHNEVIGVIHVERQDEDAFDEDAVRTAGRVAESVALSMANLRLMHRMERQAMTDPLTGLANARSFDPLVERELAIARRDGQPAAVVMLDLDHFKQFNDAHGHPAGDEALRAFSRAVRGSLRETDVASRYGGEEFAILLRNTDLEGAMVVAEKVRSAIELTPIEIGPNRFARITASLGVAASDRHGTDRLQLMRLADAALYVAKDGRNRVASAPASDGERAAPDERPTSIRARVRKARGADASAG
jgi:diguanylate cyclase (GGDEF)-like protein